MPAFRLYYNPDCSKSRAALQLLREHGIEPEQVDYRARPPSVDELRELVRLLGVPAGELLRSSDEEARSLGLDAATLSPEAALEAVAAHPRLMQRPILVHGDRGLIARPPERVLELVDARPS